MTRLSVVIITLNEEKNIEACLKSASWADEIVVVDSGSVDRTRDICLKYTDRFYIRPWAGYSAQRNAAHELASGEWILSLDADERVTPELAEEIRFELSNAHNETAGYNIPYKVFYRDKWLRYGGFFPEMHLRLFRRGKGRYGRRAVHEAIKVDGSVGTLKQFIEHFSYRSVSDFLERMERYSNLSVEEYIRIGRTTGPIRMSIRSVFNFFKMYIVRLGFMDGYEGFLMAVLYSVYIFVKYAKLRESYQEKGIG